MKIVFAIAFSTAVPAMLLAGAARLLPDAKKTVVMPSAAGRKAKLLFGPWREGMKFEASRELLFDTTGKAELALPPVSSAVYVLGDSD